jgi:hypothetical protein
MLLELSESSFGEERTADNEGGFTMFTCMFCQPQRGGTSYCVYEGVFTLISVMSAGLAVKGKKELLYSTDLPKMIRSRQTAVRFDIRILKLEVRPPSLLLYVNI